ncbi:uncharacterized protein LOC143533385 [Bidens hawaiensis]|uniref:uncharacterized protein LOC143533385 n=1 Tax=Bidens hawaiensis TaxID=980011 RepID=UPI004049BC9E
MDINLLEPLYENSTTDHPDQNIIDASIAARWFSEIQQFIMLINNPPTRTLGIMKLKNVYLNNQEIGPELGLLLWNTPGTLFHCCWYELSEGHKLLSPPRISFLESIKVCNALILIQCIASHPEARMGLIEAEILQYFYPFLVTSEKALLQFDNLRLTGLIVIKELLKDADPTSKIVHYLLKIETVPLCLRCMDVGDESAKSVAAFVIGKILTQDEGKVYNGSFLDRMKAPKVWLCECSSNANRTPYETMECMILSSFILDCSLIFTHNVLDFAFTVYDNSVLGERELSFAKIL